MRTMMMMMAVKMRKMTSRELELWNSIVVVIASAVLLLSSTQSEFDPPPSLPTIMTNHLARSACIQSRKYRFFSFKILTFVPCIIAYTAHHFHDASLRRRSDRWSISKERSLFPEYFKRVRKLAMYAASVIVGRKYDTKYFGIE